MVNAAGFVREERSEQERTIGKVGTPVPFNCKATDTPPPSSQARLNATIKVDGSTDLQSAGELSHQIGAGAPDSLNSCRSYHVNLMTQLTLSFFETKHGLREVGGPYAT